MTGLLDPRPFLRCHGCQLVQRVERLKLNARSTINLRLGDMRCYVLHHALRTSIAIANGGSNTLQLSIEQHIIDTPTVNAHTADIGLRRYLSDSPANLLLDLINGPAQVAATYVFRK